LNATCRRGKAGGSCRVNGRERRDWAHSLKESLKHGNEIARTRYLLNLTSARAAASTALAASHTHATPWVVQLRSPGAPADLDLGWGHMLVSHSRPSGECRRPYAHRGLACTATMTIYRGGSMKGLVVSSSRRAEAQWVRRARGGCTTGLMRCRCTTQPRTAAKAMGLGAGEAVASQQRTEAQWV
jgi:hypothetical protein